MSMAILRRVRKRNPLSVVTVLMASTPFGAHAVGGETIVVKGTTSEAIAAAVDRSEPGDTVSLPAGTFAITDAIRPKSGTRLIGAGQEKTVVRFTCEERRVLLTLSGCEDVEVAHLTLDGQSSPNATQGIVAGSARRLSLHHLTIRNLIKTKTWGPHGVLFSGRNPTKENGVTDSVIADCTLENIAVESKWGAGIRFAWGSSRNQVLRCAIRNTGRGGIFTNNGSTDTIIRGNFVTGSGGTGLGIEVHSGGDRSVIEDNRIDRWLSVGGCDFCSVRRNTIGPTAVGETFEEGDRPGSYGIEMIGSYGIVTDNVVDDGIRLGLSVSSKQPKNYVYYGHNTIKRCIQWAVQLQGETGGIAYHYFYRCKFLGTTVKRGNPRYPGHEGHGFRTNGNVKHVVLEECECSNNARYGLQLGGKGVDCLSFVRCSIVNNGGSAVVGPPDYSALEWTDCTVEGNGRNELTPTKPFPHAAPTATFDCPATARAGEPVQFVSTSKAAHGEIAAVLWDFGDRVPVTDAQATHAYERPGEYRVTLVVWDASGRGARVGKLLRVTEAH